MRMLSYSFTADPKVRDESTCVESTCDESTGGETRME